MPVRLRTDGDAAVVEVVDSGIGIPPADLERIFVRSYRGRNVIGRISGTGIGLAGRPFGCVCPFGGAERL